MEKVLQLLPRKFSPIWHTILIVSLVWFALPLHAQKKSNSLKATLSKIEATYKVSIIYKSSLVEGLSAKIPIETTRLTQQMPKKVLSSILPNNITYKTISDKVYVLIPKKINQLTKKITAPTGVIKGIVQSDTGEPLIGVNVAIKGTTKGTATDESGAFLLARLEAGTHILEVSYIGYVSQNQAIKIKPNDNVVLVNFKLKEDLLSFETVIVTSVPRPVVTLNSGLAITYITPHELDEVAPRSTADALQLIPGFYSESSGGEASNNLFTRGMSAEGGYQYVMLQEDGLPVYEGGNVDWVAADNYFRIDETLKAIEAIRGGSAAVFANNAPGGIINFISETGGQEFSGTAKAQVSDFGQLRTEFSMGGPIGNNYRYHVGGFYREDDGIRAPGFKANQGGQLKANITRLFKNGFIRLNGKYLNDRNILYGQIPLENAVPPMGLPFFDPNYGTLTSSNIRQIAFPTLGEPIEYDLQDGIHSQVSYIGSHLSFELGNGWQVTNKNRFAHIQKGNNSIISIFNPMTTTEYAQLHSPDPALIPMFYYADDGDPFDAENGVNNGLVVEAGWWANQSTLTNFINSFELSKSSDLYEITGGLYVSYFTNATKRNWANVLLEVSSPQPRALNLAYYNDNQMVVHETTHNGFTTYQAFDTYQNSTGSALSLSSFVYGNYQLSDFVKLDGGFRMENLSASGSLENSEIINLNTGDVYNAALANVRVGNGTYTKYDANKFDVAWSLGINALVSEKSAFHIRLSDAYRMPDFDNWERGQSAGGQIEQIFQSEVGYKLSGDNYAFFATAFMNRIQNQLAADISIDPNGNVRPIKTRGSRSVGLELESVIKLLNGFSLDITATAQNAIYQLHPDGELDSSNPINGNRVKRIPELFFRLKPAYGYKNFRIFGAMQYIGDRYADELNTSLLPAFTSYDIGLSYKYKNYDFLLHVQNVTNVIGLTEGNPRIVPEDVLSATRMARPILGRSVVAFLRYVF